MSGARRRRLWLSGSPHLGTASTWRPAALHRCVRRGRARACLHVLELEAAVAWQHVSTQASTVGRCAALNAASSHCTSTARSSCVQVVVATGGGCTWCTYMRKPRQWWPQLRMRAQLASRCQSQCRIDTSCLPLPLYVCTHAGCGGNGRGAPGVSGGDSSAAPVLHNYKTAPFYASTEHSCPCPCVQVVVATGGGHLVYLEVTAEGGLVERATVQLPGEIACVDVTPASASAGRYGRDCVLVSTLCMCVGKRQLCRH